MQKFTWPLGMLPPAVTVAVSVTGVPRGTEVAEEPPAITERVVVVAVAALAIPHVERRVVAAIKQQRRKRCIGRLPRLERINSAATSASMLVPAR